MDILRNVPLGLYLEAPQTWLHRVDPRVKAVWLLSFILTPILANSSWRLGLVGLLIVLTVCSLPRRVWIRQCTWVLALGVLMFSLTALAPDALGVTSQEQRQDIRDPAYGLVTPAAEDAVVPVFPQSYTYEIIHTQVLGIFPVRMSRRSIALGIRVGTLVFTLFYVSTLFLLTTAPEEITTGLAALASPLKKWGIPVAEITLTTTLALRFLPLVLEEVQNLIRSLRTRDIHWQGLGLRGAVQIVITLVDRLLENLLLRSEQTALAMQVRGYVGPDHAVTWYKLSLTRTDYGLLLVLPLFWGLRLFWFHGDG